MGDFAPNRPVNEMIAQFLRSKRLKALGHDELSILHLKEMGLYDDIDLLEELETAWSDYTKYKRGLEDLKRGRRKHGR